MGIKGKMFRVYQSDLVGIIAGEEVPFSYAKFKFVNNNETLELKSKSPFYKMFWTGSKFDVYTNAQSSIRVCSIEPSSLTDIEYIDFRFDYDDNDYDISEPDQWWDENMEALPTDFSQVSIYNQHQSKWVDLPCCSEYSGTATTVVDSGRNAEAVVIADVIASDIAKVEMKWNFLTVEQYSEIAQLFEPKYNNDDPQAFFRAVRFFDVVKGDFDGDNSTAPNTTTNRCRIMYCGDRKVSFAHIKLDSDGKPIGYTDVSLNLIDTHKIYGE